MTPAEITKARDRILRDVMAETPEEYRGSLLTVAIKSNNSNNSMRDKAAFIDCFVLVSILSQVGIVNLHDDDDNDDDYHDLVDHDGLEYEVDDDGRIIEFSIFDEEET